MAFCSKFEVGIGAKARGFMFGFYVLSDDGRTVWWASKWATFMTEFEARFES